MKIVTFAFAVMGVVAATKSNEGAGCIGNSLADAVEKYGNKLCVCTIASNGTFIEDCSEECAKSPSTYDSVLVLGYLPGNNEHVVCIT